MMLLDTIAAISTPYGKGGIAVIRISGDRALEIADKVFELEGKNKGNTFADIPPRQMCRGTVWRNYENGNRRERVCIDDGMAVVFRAPASFTGEDVVEISCHGGLLVSSSVLSAVIEAGARTATAGEFTRRAFVNGKMKLTQAESLGLLLEAQTENQLLISRAGMRGILSEATQVLYSRLIDVMGSVWAKIDFPEEDLAEMSRDDIVYSLEAVKNDIFKLASTYRTGKAIVEGIPTAICGHTNVGKSSVYNLIVGYDAAIVTDVEGTTRDILRQNVSFGGVTLRLSDTAGIRQTDDLVEGIGIERALKEISECELIFAVFDATDKNTVNSEDIEFYRLLMTEGKQVVALCNKSDIASPALPEEISSTFDKIIKISAKTGEGFDELEKLVSEMYIDGSISLSNDAVVADARQYSALLSCNDSLTFAIDALRNQLPLDLCAVDIEGAISKLGEVDGREVGEDVVSNIFSRFCVGK